MTLPQVRNVIAISEDLTFDQAPTSSLLTLDLFIITNLLT